MLIAMTEMSQEGVMYHLSHDVFRWFRRSCLDIVDVNNAGKISLFHHVPHDTLSWFRQRLLAMTNHDDRCENDGLVTNS